MQLQNKWQLIATGFPEKFRDTCGLLTLLLTLHFDPPNPASSEQHARNALQTEAFSSLPAASRISHWVYSWQRNFWLTDLSSCPWGLFSNTFSVHSYALSLVLRPWEKPTSSSFWKLQPEVQCYFNLHFHVVPLNMKDLQTFMPPSGPWKSILWAWKKKYWKSH